MANFFMGTPSYVAMMTSPPWQTLRYRRAGVSSTSSLDGSIAVGLLATTLACRRGIPGHLGVKPDRQRAPALERFTVGWPVPGLVSRGCVSAHTSQLPRWIHEMNPQRDLCNRAHI